MTRKTPIRHRVRSHQREGRIVKSYSRGKGTKQYLAVRKVVLPKLPPIEEWSIFGESTLKDLVWNNRRKELLQKALKELPKAKEAAGITNSDITETVVIGSFTSRQVSCPNDLDLVCLVKKGSIRNPYLTRNSRTGLFFKNYSYPRNEHEEEKRPPLDIYFIEGKDHYLDYLWEGERFALEGAIGAKILRLTHAVNYEV